MATNDTTAISLSNLKEFKAKCDELYATKEGVTSAAGVVYTLTKTDLDASDSTSLATISSPKQNDVAIIETVLNGLTYELSSYIYSESSNAWEAITGNVDADKVILRDDITLAGDYTQVGNITKTSTGTATFSTKGMSVAAALTEIFSKRLQPTITAQPSVSGFSLTNAGAKEAGTTISSASFGTAVLNAGSYTYGPATGITAASYTVDRVCVPSSMSGTSVATTASGTDSNGGSGFIIGDTAETNVVSSLAYKVTVTYAAGAVAYDNLGDASDPTVQIAAGSKTQTTSAMTSYRNYFYGTTSSTTPLSGTSITSDFIRGLTKSGKAYASGTITLSVPAGATGVYIACINGKTGVTKVINETALNADVTSTFTKQTSIMVEGANNFTSVAYNVWYFIPAVAYGNAATLKVTLG